jgi:hypothetical protein
MIAQYIADNIDYIMWLGGYLALEEVDRTKMPKGDSKYRIEIEALGKLAFLEQLGNDWCYVATPHHLTELHAGQPTANQVAFYRILANTWNDSGWFEAYPLDMAEVECTYQALEALGLKDTADRLHLAQAIVLNASWFLTNDSDVLRKCQNADLPLHVCRPSECLERISVGLFLK